VLTLHNLVKFPLTGRHQQLACQACHGAPFKQVASAECSTCHQPPGSYAGMSTICGTCHSPDGFRPARFSHPPVGEHIPGGEHTLGCTDCHRAGVFSQRTCMGSGCHDSNNPGDEPERNDD
jgi:hypothetical protein